jgi:cytochrome c oxidase subunit 3
VSPRRTVLDVSDLPTVVFGHRSLMWWGTLGFIVIEAFTIMLMVASYFYLRLDERTWPPAPTPNPDVLLPALNVLLLLVIMIPMYRADQAARRFDGAGVVRGLSLATGLALASLVLRYFELLALNVRWDSHAYGSALWAIVILHGTLLVVDTLETGTFMAIFLTGRAREKHYADVSDAAFYQYYLSISWVPLYFIVYWSPRLL